ncbi:MAG: hypothetical protein JSV96_12080 [Candidatus Aminicenantes bacterium]|nr:MAG: hypothetical protein JSV96_12080 [Candidatus Aminicenantes bacterium]
MPGDSIIPRPMAAITHAIKIKAPPERVWPWLAQMGAGRGGWYSYDFIDNGGNPSAISILLQYQKVACGDVFPAIPGATDAFIAAVVEQPWNLVLTVPKKDGGNLVSWDFLLKPLDQGYTRLIVRARISPHWLERTENDASPDSLVLIERIYGVLAKIPRPLLLSVAGFGHRIMEARMLRGIKRRAEERIIEVRLE